MPQDGFRDGACAAIVQQSQRLPARNGCVDAPKRGCTPEARHRFSANVAIGKSFAQVVHEQISERMDDVRLSLAFDRNGQAHAVTLRAPDTLEGTCSCGFQIRSCGDRHCVQGLECNECVEECGIDFGRATIRSAQARLIGCTAIDSSHEGRGEAHLSREGARGLRCYGRLDSLPAKAARAPSAADECRLGHALEQTDTHYGLMNGDGGFGHEAGDGCGVEDVAVFWNAPFHRCTCQPASGLDHEVCRRISITAWSAAALNWPACPPPQSPPG